MSKEFGDYLLFVSLSGKVVEVTLFKEGDCYIAETRIGKNISIATHDTELKALVSTMPPIFANQAHNELKRQLREENSDTLERVKELG